MRWRMRWIVGPACRYGQRWVDEGRGLSKYRGVAHDERGERVAPSDAAPSSLDGNLTSSAFGLSIARDPDEAEALEHIVSDRFVKAIARKLGEPNYDPHGDPIPNLDGIMQKRNLQPLTSLRMHTPARIRRFIMDDPAMLQNTQERGLVMGVTLEVVERDPFDGPVTVRLGAESTQTIGYKMASSILVEFIDRMC